MIQEKIFSYSSNPFLTKEMSIYFDLVRFVAALAVLFAHLKQDGFYASWMLLSNFGHEAVIIFFVLSGYVISHTTLAKGRRWQDYLISRTARIYSVVLPAIFFSFFVSAIRAYIDGNIAIEQFLTNDLTFWNFLSSVFFLNESWLNSAELPSNPPYWSLCYEVWYYVFFGFSIYLSGWLRWISLIVASAIAGPSIALLFPVWLLGVYLSFKKYFLVRSWLGGFLFVGSFILIFAISSTGIDVSVRESLYEIVPGFWRLDSSQRFVTDYAIGIAILANFIGFRAISMSFSKFLLAMERPIRFFAGCTFSIYLCHRPMTLLAGDVFPNSSQDVFLSVFLFVAILTICILIARVTEFKLKAWRIFLQRLFFPGKNALKDIA